MPFTLSEPSPVFGHDVQIRRRRAENMMDQKYRPHSCLQTIRLTLPHLFLVLIVVLYALLGAYLFSIIESSNDLIQRNQTIISLREDMKDYLQSLRANLRDERQFKDFKINLKKLFEAQEQAFSQHKISTNQIFDKTSQVGTSWDYSNSVLFAFTLITTIGYGNLAPRTFYGRILCMIYGIIGIPITMLAIANIGKFLSEFMYSTYTHARDLMLGEPTEDGETSVRVRHGPVLVLMAVFIVYIILGATVLPLWEDLNFFDSCYLSFITITTCGFGDIVPQKTLFYFPTIVYFTFGLAIATMTIDVSAAYFRRLHFLGMKIKGAKDAFVWFGSKVLTVGEIVHAVGKEHGIPRRQLETFLEKDNFDEVVTHVVEEKEFEEAQRKLFKKRKGNMVPEEKEGLLAPLFHAVEWRFIDDSRTSSMSGSTRRISSTEKLSLL